MMESRTEKKTGKFGRFMGWLISVVLIAALAWGFVSMYPRMTQEARNVYSEVVRDKKEEKLTVYVREVAPLIDGMYVDWYKNSHRVNKTPGEIILGESKAEYSDNVSYMTWYEQRMNSLSIWYETSYAEELESSGIKYYISSGDKTDGYGTLDPEVADKNLGKYPLLIRIGFDETGTMLMYSSHGMQNANQHFWDAYSRNMSKNEKYDYSTGQTISHGITGVTVVIACERDVYDALLQDISISSWNIHESVYETGQDYLIFVLAAVAGVILLGLLLPTIRPLGLQEGWKANIWVEVLIAAGIVTAWAVIDLLPEFVVKSQMEIENPGLLIYWVGIIKEVMADGRAEYFIFAVNVILWFAVFFVVYLCTINLRQLFAKGVARFFKENTLTGKLLCFVVNWTKKTVEFCGTIDFSNKGNRNFFLAVVLNFIIIAVLCCTWFFGILLAIPYSLFLFWLLQKWWNKIRTDYTVMLSTTEEMAQGITDVEYVADAGIFHELNSALSGVQEGFHTAVQEEVKSQRMKTELITNVSHDLKTPLTAIITYVDLLKNEGLSEEERKNYVDVLDRKSLRLKTLIEDLFEISKAASGEIKLDKMDLDLVQLIQEVQMELEEEIMNSGITFKMNLPEEKVMLPLDAQKTGRIFENLTLNILKHGLTGSRAYISVQQTEKYVHVMYKNVSSEEINFSADEILERFTRGDASRNTEGSGLGLAIVKSFTEAQGGKVKVDLEDDLFKVTVSFPRVQVMQMPVKEVRVEEVAEEVTEEITEAATTME